MQKGFRHEYKFLISQASAQLLKSRLPGFMRRDPHAGPTGQYTIRSLYFDDQDFSAYTDKMSGVRDRVKYRIRYYNYDDRVIKLEKKEKHENLTRKIAQTVTRADALALEQCLRSGCPDHPKGLTEELRVQISCGMRPRVLVDYDRTPFVCNAGNTRITLDENIRTHPYNGELFASPHAMIPVLEDNQVVLEVKFDDFLPGYLSEVLEDIPKVNLAISKYVLCLNLI
ncbi:MAG: polyphosphate polymerase domain-containing protein [Oscillospiraceae bacterium]|nr:polyphosphate polymerase domain-containing protein [Oscillospiraceae bacterium]